MVRESEKFLRELQQDIVLDFRKRAASFDAGRLTKEFSEPVSWYHELRNWLNSAIDGHLGQTDWSEIEGAETRFFKTTTKHVCDIPRLFSDPNGYSNLCEAFTESCLLYTSPSPRD